MARKMWNAVLGLAVILCAASGLSSAAYAHAKLLSSVPTANATVTATPEIVLIFNQKVQALQGRLVDLQSNIASDLPEPKNEGEVLRYQVSTPLVPGNYEVVYRVATPDTHVVSGSVRFAIAP